MGAFTKGAAVGVGVLQVAIGLAMAIWVLTQAFSDEMKVALVGFGVTVAGIGVSYILSGIATREASNADQRFDDIERRLDNIEAAVQATNGHPVPKGWVRALFYESPQTVSGPPTLHPTG